MVEEAILNLRVDLVEPLLCAIGLLPVCFNLGFELCDAILRSSKLVCKSLRSIDCMPAVLLGNVSSFAQKLQDRLTSSVELSVVDSRTLSRSCKLNHFGTHC